MKRDRRQSLNDQIIAGALGSFVGGFALALVLGGVLAVAREMSHTTVLQLALPIGALGLGMAGFAVLGAIVFRGAPADSDGRAVRAAHRLGRWYSRQVARFALLLVTLTALLLMLWLAVLLLAGN